MKYLLFSHEEHCSCDAMIKTRNKKYLKRFIKKHKECKPSLDHQESTSSHDRRPNYEFIGFIPNEYEYPH